MSHFRETRLFPSQPIIDIHREKQEVRRGISDFFNGVYATKTSTNGKFSFYHAKIEECLLCIENNYLVIVVVDDYNSIGHEEYVSNLQWVSFQTRTMNNSPKKLESQKQIKLEDDSRMIKFLNSKISSIEKKSDRQVYSCENIPILKIELLFAENENYADTGTIKSALDTWNCVLYFIM